MAGTVVSRGRESCPLEKYKSQSRVASLPQLFRSTCTEYIIYSTHSSIITYLAQSQPTWHRVDLPDCKNSRLTVELILKCNTCLKSGKVANEYRLLADL